MPTAARRVAFLLGAAPDHNQGGKEETVYQLLLLKHETLGPDTANPHCIHVPHHGLPVQSVSVTAKPQVACLEVAETQMIPNWCEFPSSEGLSSDSLCPSTLSPRPR